jgi:hypothetical protein
MTTLQTGGLLDIPLPLREDIRPKGRVKCFFVRSSSLEPPCYCEGRRFSCPGCLRFVPECFGAADDIPEVCDDCWRVLHGCE